MLQLRQELARVDLEVLEVDVGSQLRDEALAVLNAGELDELVRGESSRAADDRAEDSGGVAGGLRLFRDREGETDVDRAVLLALELCGQRPALLRLEGELLERRVEREENAGCREGGVSAQRGFLLSATPGTL